MNEPVTMLTVTPNGANAKLGPGVATTHRPVGPTCPRSCPLLGHGCYAQRGRVQIHAKRSADRSDALRTAAGNTLIRHLVSGDALKTTADGRRIVDRGLVREMLRLHIDAKWLTGWGYTHAPEQLDRAGFGPSSGRWPANFRLLASCSGLQEKQRLNAAGWQTARVIDDAADKAPDETLCPVDAAKRNGKPQPTTCARCRLCFDDESRNIAFLKF